jgi:hypothetical protein
MLVIFAWLWSLVTFLPRRAARFWPWKKPKLYRYERVDDFPDSLKGSRVYIAGERGNLWAAAMLCPCGCGETIELNLLKEVRPRWSAEQHSDGTVSLKPSVWRQKGCRSHFVVSHGHINWC